MTDQDPSSRILKRRVPDPQNAPTGEIRKLIQSAFDARTLSRFCEEHGVFRQLRPSFPSRGSLDDMIDVIIEFCRTRDRWEELLDSIAQYSPSVYNRTAAQLGWQPVPENARILPIVQTERPIAPHAYDDIEIHVTPGPDDEYLVTIHTATAGDASDPMKKRWTAENLSLWLAQLELGQTDRDSLEGIGKQLFLSLLGEHVRIVYAQAWAKAAVGLRLRLRFDAPELQALPWELLWDAGPPHEFLALSGKTWVTRYLSVPRGTPPLAVEPPLGVFIVTASPKDQPSIDVDTEEATIRDALAPLETAGLVRVEGLCHAQLMTLREALRDQRPHVLHFVGHGAMRPEGGVLLLEDKNGLSRVLPAEDLRLMLQYTPTIRLAVLNACATAQGAADVPRFDAQRSAVLGVGPELVRAGLGAVVAMQFSLSDVSARLFAQDFYKTLARLEPVDLAVARAREALRLEIGVHSRDWATPVLFLRAPDGVIFAPDHAVAPDL